MKLSKWIVLFSPPRLRWSAIVQRMRLTSSDEVIRVADQVTRLVLQAYAAPDRTLDELRAHVAAQDVQWDPLQEFAEACRMELRSLRG